MDRVENTRVEPLQEDSVVGYLPTWAELPAESKMTQYSIILLFAATTLVKVGESNFQCDINCHVSFPDASSYEHVREIARMISYTSRQAAILTFGGHAMNPCWKYCLSNTDKMAEEVVDLVVDLGLDGVDINIEVRPSPLYSSFILNLTRSVFSALHNQDPSKKWIISHSPIAHHLGLDLLRFHSILQLGGHSWWIPSRLDT